MEAIKGQIGGSSLILTDEGITITIPRGYWTKRQWTWLVQLVSQLMVTGVAWVTAPSTISAVLSPWYHRFNW